MNPWPRTLVVRSVLILAAIVVALAVRSPRFSRPPSGLGDLRDAVSDHKAMLSGGHASFTCATCHFAHAAKAERPLWQKQGTVDSSLFVRDSEAAGGVKTGLCMSCHDGTIAPTIKAHSVGGVERVTALGADPSANHPVGVDYLAALRRDPGSYNDPAMNHRIILEDGRVGCVSCHATHEVTASAGNVRPEVCLDCHVR